MGVTDVWDVAYYIRENFVSIIRHSGGKGLRTDIKSYKVQGYREMSRKKLFR